MAGNRIPAASEKLASIGTGAAGRHRRAAEPDSRGDAHVGSAPGSDPEEATDNPLAGLSLADVFGSGNGTVQSRSNPLFATAHGERGQPPVWQDAAGAVPSEASGESRRQTSLANRVALKTSSGLLGRRSSSRLNGRRPPGGGMASEIA